MKRRSWRISYRRTRRTRMGRGRMRRGRRWGRGRRRKLRGMRDNKHSKTNHKPRYSSNVNSMKSHNSRLSLSMTLYRNTWYSWKTVEWCATRTSSTNPCSFILNKSANCSRETGSFSRHRLWWCSNRCWLMPLSYLNATKLFGLIESNLSEMSVRSSSSWCRGISWPWWRHSSIIPICP